MSTRSTAWEFGTPCWFDLTALDLGATTRFYADTLGWELMDTGADYGHYTFCMVRGMPVAGIGSAPSGSPDQAPTVWTVYLSVDDADKTAQAVVEHGGTIAMAPVAIGDQGRMALAVDPTGAAVGLWEAGAMFGAVLVNEPGGVVWNDHRSVDPAAAQAFYTGVFGYRYSTVEGDPSYVTVDGAGPGGTVAGIGGPDPELPAGTPAHWMTYLAVSSVDDAAARAGAGGGSVVSGPADTPFGRMATLRDPQGTYVKIGSGAVPDEA